MAPVHPKIGRKGDPRMNRAVSARLHDPALSLFDALKVGGFEYYDDEDSNAMDSEGVTLAQRKNQLSRRLRMAKKGNEPESPALSGIKRVLDDDPSVSNKQEKQNQKEPELMAKFHPDYYPLTIPRVHLSASAQPTQQGNFQQPPGNFPFMSPVASSGVALASLTMTATSLGMSLEQLAMALQNSQNLYQMLGQKNNKDAVALNFFTNEAKSMYSRVMLLAGYSPQEAQEGSQQNLQFAIQAWKQEYKRLKELAPDSFIEVQDAPDSFDDEIIPQKKAGHSHEGHSHDHAHEQESQECCLDGRHMHSLEGACGHRPILHQPADGSAHIDFVVGDKVECYAGIPAHRNTMWPSSQSCENLGCNNAHKVDKNHEHDSNCTTARKTQPKMLNLEELDMSGDEWNSDFKPDESGISGLFELAKENSAGV